MSTWNVKAGSANCIHVIVTCNCCFTCHQICHLCHQLYVYINHICHGQANSNNDDDELPLFHRMIGSNVQLSVHLCSVAIGTVLIWVYKLHTVKLDGHGVLIALLVTNIKKHYTSYKIPSTQLRVIAISAQPPCSGDNYTHLWACNEVYERHAGVEAFDSKPFGQIHMQT